MNQKVHEHSINVTNFETYLGDIVCNSGTNDKNIEKRHNQGIGSVAQIFTMLGQVSLGHYHFEIALVLRDSMLVSKLVFNSEVWYNITIKQILKLEQIDEMFFRKLFSLAKSAPREGMYIECGKMAIRFITWMRQIMYYRHILKKELINKFLTAQKITNS